MNLAQVRNVVVTLVGAAVFVVLADLAVVAGYGLFEVDRPTLFARLQALWSFLALVVPGLGIGVFAARSAVTLSAAAYLLGEMIIIYRHNWFGYRAAGNYLPEGHYVIYSLRDVLIWAAIGGVMGLIGAWLRRRLTIGSSDRGSRLR